MPEAAGKNRRPLASRDTGWARRMAAALVRAKASPDLISFASVPVALVGAGALLALEAPWGPLLCAVMVQLRLLCNLLDGMVAVEGGRGGPTGALWNELPDRVADSVLVIALGYAAGSPALGWAGALFAALTAYVRATGGALGFEQDFSGMFAKPRRMFVLTVACLIASFQPFWRDSVFALDAGAWIIAVGSLLTCIGRTQRLAAKLRARADGAEATAATEAPARDMAP
ncbi:CDP-alcohol phosphatidyltransferase family protein [Arenimonas composti]|uniref:CDP-diacylglycerol--glycerol-3-phosphate 3-phosphatidyltransferase n=1 Tax=Arenimonas composti TR7-09 = DSM 18010 TaxID=1121013 RepID=A0A091BGT7_9GAMM|nr:CDP-alcohol phosphatidyltransferase family protein [Arenimonas composti]KFN50772.1 hypothetical protein P873_05120 [Arenimonas composti TR7-09 = DSM 18010]